jgi:hypothetical protein
LVKVTNANQVLKASNTESNPNEVSLRDKKIDTGFLEFAGFKNFVFTSFFVGVNLYFGIKDVLYKF